MKRVGFLIEDIAEMKNLTLAFYKAAKGKGMSEEVESFRKDLPQNLQKLRRQILTGDVSVGKYHYFKIHDPKERLICAAAFDERVLHHAIMNVCHPVFERHLIFDTYATRIDKGVYRALAKVERNMTQYKYVAKLDVRKYFDNISHDILLQKLTRLFKDKRLMVVLEKIIRSYYSGINDPIREVNRGRGVPIGNLTSQYFANHYLSQNDHFIKEQLHVPFYVRYMDDMLLMGDDKDVLKRQVQAVDRSLQLIGLTLKPVVINKTTLGVPFLGYKLYPHKILLSSTSKQRFREKLTTYEENLQSGKWSEKEYQRHVIPLIAFTQFAYAKRLRKEILEGSNRVLRGGSWNNNASNCRAANRNNNSPGNRNNNNGFRLALAQKTVSDDPLVNRESSCVSAKDTENEQCLIAKHPILVGMPEVLSKNLDVFISSIITKSSSIK